MAPRYEYEWHVINALPAAPGWWTEWRFPIEGEDQVEVTYSAVPAWAVVERREYLIATRELTKDGDRERMLVAFNPDYVIEGRVGEIDNFIMAGECVSHYVYSATEPEDHRDAMTLREIKDRAAEVKRDAEYRAKWEAEQAAKVAK